MIDDDQVQSNLGDRLLEGVRNLWQRVNALGKISDHHGHEIETIKRELSSLKSQVHGLKVSRGKARAKAERAWQELEQLERRLN